jgi:hypothetical protein
LLQVKFSFKQVLGLQSASINLHTCIPIQAQKKPHALKNGLGNIRELDCKKASLILGDGCEQDEVDSCIGDIISNIH